MHKVRKCFPLVGWWLLTGVLTATSASAAAAASCASDGILSFYCDVVLAEDSAGLPGTPWLISGRLGFGGNGGLQAVHTGTGRVVSLQPRARAAPQARSPFSACPGPPSPDQLSIGGIALGSRSRHGWRLYAANDGGRRAIEVFHVRMVAEVPEAEWAGCVVLPADTNPNAVTALSNGGLAVVSMDDGGEQRMRQHESGVATGRVFEWHPRRGLRELAVPALRGGNGLVGSADGRWLFVSAWAGGELWRIDRRGREPPRREQLGFLPDNIKRSRDGSLWIAGQRPPVERISRCTGNPCPADWVIARVDPRTLTARIVLERAGTTGFNYATGAVEHGAALYINGRGQHGMARFALPARSTR